MDLWILFQKLPDAWVIYIWSFVYFLSLGSLAPRWNVSIELKCTRNIITLLTFQDMEESSWNNWGVCKLNAPSQLHLLFCFVLFCFVLFCFVNFTGYSIYLQFKLSPFPVSPLQSPIPSPCFYEVATPPTQLPTPASPAQAFSYDGASSLHRTRTKGFLSHWWQISPSSASGAMVPPCLLFRCLFKPWGLWGLWLVNIVVLPVGFQTPSAPSVLP
jgi:hypothetical protein